MRITTIRALTVAGIAGAALAVLAPAAMAQGYPGGPYYRSQPDLGFAPRPDFPGPKQAKQPTLREKCATYAQKNASEAEPGARKAFFESCIHGMNTTAK